MNGGHQAFDDAEVVVENLCHGSQAVGGAGSVGNELHVRGVLLEVDAADEHRGVILCRAGHNDDLCAGVDMGLCGFLGEEAAGALQNVLYAKLAPGNESGITVLVIGKDFDLLAVNDENALFVASLDGTVETAVDGVVLHGIGQLACGMTGSVDCNDLDVVRLDSCSESQRADAAETIDANFDHISILHNK